jgi:DNA-binding transcriptional LysR family regulator
LVPTDEAHALFREVDEVFSRISSLQVTANNLRNTGTGHLRIGVAPSLGLEVAPRAIAAFRTKYPNVTFDVKTLHHNDTSRALYERECDLSIGYDPPEHPRLKLEKLSAARLYLICQPGTFSSGKTTLKIGELNGLDMISVNGSGPIGDLVEATLEKAQVDVRKIISVSTYYIAAALVRFGSGIAIVDQFTARSMVSDGLEALSISPEMQFGVHAIWLEDRPPSRLGLQFVAEVKKALQP